MKKMKYTNTPQYFTIIFYVAGIMFLTSLALIYSCFRYHTLTYLAVGIFGLIFGIIGLIEFISKKRIFPHGQYHWLREILALILLAIGVFIVRTGSLSGIINWREKMVVIICFVLGMHALHLRGFIKAEEK